MKIEKIAIQNDQHNEEVDFEIQIVGNPNEIKSMIEIANQLCNLVNINQDSYDGLSKLKVK